MLTKDDDFMPLIRAALIQAAADLHNKKPETALDAVTFFVSGDAVLYLDAIGMNYDPVTFITSGQASKPIKRPGAMTTGDVTVLEVFEGLAPSHARELSMLVVPTLRELRRVVTREATNGGK